MNKEEFREKIKKYEMDDELMKNSIESIKNYIEYVLKYIPDGTIQDKTVEDTMEYIIERYEKYYKLSDKYSDLIYHFYEKSELFGRVKFNFGVNNIRDVDSKKLIEFADCTIVNIKEDNDKYILYFRDGLPLSSNTWKFKYSNDGNYTLLDKEFLSMS